MKIRLKKLKIIFFILILLIFFLWLIEFNGNGILTDFVVDQQTLSKPTLISIASITAMPGYSVYENITMKYRGHYRVSIFFQEYNNKIEKNSISTELKYYDFSMGIKFEVYSGNQSIYNERYSMNFEGHTLGLTLVNLKVPGQLPLNRELKFVFTIEKIDPLLDERYESFNFRIQRAPLIWE